MIKVLLTIILFVIIICTAILYLPIGLLMWNYGRIFNNLIDNNSLATKIFDEIWK